MRWTAAVALLTLWPSLSRANDGVASFVGLTAVSIEVGVSETAGEYALASDLQTMCELRLRAAGIPLYRPPKDDDKLDTSKLETWSKTALFLGVLATNMCENSVAMSMRLSNWQLLARIRGRGDLRNAPAEVWSTSRLVGSDRGHAKATLMEEAAAMVDIFINEWQAAHPVARGGEGGDRH